MIDSIVEIRLLVAFLGETNKWWNSSFLNEVGIQFLKYSFPKTFSLAAFTSATEVAKKNHDLVLGPGKFHLFRLPGKIESKIFQLLPQHDIASFIQSSNKENAIHELRKYAELVVIDGQEGPFHVGNQLELNDKDILAVVARHYFDAFQENYQTYPYFK